MYAGIPKYRGQEKYWWGKTAPFSLVYDEFNKKVAGFDAWWLGIMNNDDLSPQGKMDTIQDGLLDWSQSVFTGPRFLSGDKTRGMVRSQVDKILQKTANETGIAVNIPLDSPDPTSTIWSGGMTPSFMVSSYLVPNIKTIAPVIKEEGESYFDKIPSLVAKFKDFFADVAIDTTAIKDKVGSSIDAADIAIKDALGSSIDVA